MTEGNVTMSAGDLVKRRFSGPLRARLATDLLSEHGGLLAALAALIVVSLIFAPHFASIANILDILRQMAFTGIIGLGMTLVIIAGEIDISVGSAVAFTSALFGVVAVNWGLPFPIATAIVLTVATAIGLCAGAVRAFFGVPSFIVTLALFSALKGGALLLTDAIPIPILDDSFNWWGTGAFMGLPVPALILVILFAIFSAIANRTSFGRSVYTIGGNAEAAYLSGIPVAAVQDNSLRAYWFPGGRLGTVANIAARCRKRRDGRRPRIRGHHGRHRWRGEPVRRKGFDARHDAGRLVHSDSEQRNGSLRRKQLRAVCRKRTRRAPRRAHQHAAVARRLWIGISVD